MSLEFLRSLWGPITLPQQVRRSELKKESGEIRNGVAIFPLVFDLKFRLYVDATLRFGSLSCHYEKLGNKSKDSTFWQHYMDILYVCRLLL